MNANKAREFFSAYYEGSMDRAIRQTFERRLNSDSELHAEYKAFEQVMRRLDTLKDQPVEVPSDLHERISARLDKQIYESKRETTAKGIGGWWKSFALAGTACVALVAALIAIKGSNSGSTSTAGVAAPVVAPPSIKDVNGTIRLEYKHPASASQRAVEKLTVREGVDGKVISETELKPGLELNQALVNRSDKPALMSIEKGETRILVVVPGTQQVSVKSGSGSVQDLALALSGFYKVTVELEVSNLAEKATWSFDSTNPVDATMTVGDKALSLNQLSGSLYILHQ
ncbi:MAG: hypothetical protein K1X67_04880 [Fimbriimonadaceae bacterium]|nr:hypothetical protein [Fimbriimonadaceae bacterium]